MKKILFAMAVVASMMAISALADKAVAGCCPKAKECPMTGASTNAPACTNAPVAVKPAQ
jgi:hypothetical protein